jgi:hypothetical protein
MQNQFSSKKLIEFYLSAVVQATNHDVVVGRESDSAQGPCPNVWKKDYIFVNRT